MSFARKMTEGLVWGLVESLAENPGLYSRRMPLGWQIVIWPSHDFRILFIDSLHVIFSIPFNTTTQQFGIILKNHLVQFHCNGENFMDSVPIIWNFKSYIVNKIQQCQQNLTPFSKIKSKCSISYACPPVRPNTNITEWNLLFKSWNKKPYLFSITFQKGQRDVFQESSNFLWYSLEHTTIIDRNAIFLDCCQAFDEECPIIYSYVRKNCIRCIHVWEYILALSSRLYWTF